MTWPRRIALLGFVLLLFPAGSDSLVPPILAPNDHYDGVRFFNPQQDRKRARDLLRWISNRDIGAWPEKPRMVPTAVPPRQAAPGEWRLTFVNHSTMLLQHGATSLLTDPIWSERTSPVSWAGPRRRVSPGVRFKDLPRIDAVLLSHNHYDHMDMPSLIRLAAEHDPVFVVPMGNAIYLASHGISRTIELDWWEDTVISSDLAVTAVPARHWSRRGLLDMNRALWSGFFIKTPNDNNVYFAGDTGFGPHFKTIRDRLGAPRIALLPIGSYLPRWFMKAQHMNPEEALRAHNALNATTSIAIHFGTFPLADDGMETPVTDLASALIDAGIDAHTFRIPENGTSYRF